MVFKKLSVLLLKTKVASALEGLTHLQSKRSKQACRFWEYLSNKGSFIKIAKENNSCTNLYRPLFVYIHPGNCIWHLFRHPNEKIRDPFFLENVGRGQASWLYSKAFLTSPTYTPRPFHVRLYRRIRYLKQVQYLPNTLSSPASLGVPNILTGYGPDSAGRERLAG